MDGRSDLYSLGIVLHETLGGELPFAGTSTEMLEAKGLSGEAPRLPHLGPEIPAAVKEIARKLLAFDARESFQSGEELASALTRARFDSPSVLLNLPVQPARRGRRPNARTMLLGLGLLLGGAAILLRQRLGTEAALDAPQRIAVLPFVSLNPAEDEYFAHGITDDVRGKLAALPGVLVTACLSSDQYSRSAKGHHPHERALALTKEDLLSLPETLSSFNGFHTKHGKWVLMNPNRQLMVAGAGAVLLLVAVAWLVRWYFRRHRAARAAAI